MVFQIFFAPKMCVKNVLSVSNQEIHFRKERKRPRKLLEVVSGPINPTSNGGKRYIITFMDDLSWKPWVYFLQEKSEALMAFQSYKALVDKEGVGPKEVLHTDHRGESWFCKISWSVTY